MYGIIYKATNSINGKVYIGLTKSSLERRKYEHELKAKRRNTRLLYFHRALRKHGLKNFVWEVIDSADDSAELCEREKFWITYYGAYGGYGYNLTPGGEDNSHSAKEVYEFSLDGELIAIYKSAVKAGERYKVLSGDIGRVANGKLHTKSNRVFLYSEEWDSLSSMQKEVKRRVKKISVHKKRSGGKGVVAIDRSMKVRFFPSIYSAEKKTGTCKDSIRKNLKSKISGTKEWIFLSRMDFPSDYDTNDEFQEKVKAHFEHIDRPAYLANPITQKTIPSQSRIYRYSLGGIYTETYLNVFDVIHDLKIAQNSYSNIIQCSRGDKKQAFGSFWLLESEYPDESSRKKEIARKMMDYNKSKKKQVPLLAILPNGNSITFKSKVECANHFGITRATVSRKIKNTTPCPDGSFLYEAHLYEEMQKSKTPA